MKNIFRLNSNWIVFLFNTQNTFKQNLTWSSLALYSSVTYLTCLSLKMVRLDLIRRVSQIICQTPCSSLEWAQDCQDWRTSLQLLCQFCCIYCRETVKDHFLSPWLQIFIHTSVWIWISLEEKKSFARLRRWVCCLSVVSCSLWAIGSLHECLFSYRCYCIWINVSFN